jgi:hypothetical protein
MVIVKKPQPGMWTLRIAGSGISGMVVQGRSAIGIASVGFAPVSASTFTRVPSIGVENVVRIRVNGPAEALHASLVNGAAVRLADLPLAAADADGAYLSRLTPGSQGFRVLVSGTDADGFPFQRVSAPLLTAIR